jgi:ribosomal protein S3AE
MAMAIADSFRDMPDFVTKKRVYESDFVAIRHRINELLREKLHTAQSDILVQGLDEILPGTTTQT